MSALPHDTILGTLTLVEVFVFYDEPRLFSCSSASGQLYLSVWVEDLEAYSRWLYVAVSVTRLEHVRSGSVELRSAFEDAENAVVAEVLVPFAAGPSEVKIHAAVRIPNEWLPKAGAKIELRTQTIPAAVTDLHSMATSSRREAVEVHVEVPGMYRSEAPAKFLGRCLQTVQELVDALAQRAAAQATAAKKKVAIEYSRMSRLFVTELVPGSLGVRLLAPTTGVFANEIARDALSHLVVILKLGASEKLSEELSSLKGRVAVRYRRLLETLIEGQSPLFIEWAASIPELGASATLPLDVAKSALAIVSQIETKEATEFEIAGKFKAIDLKAKSFKFWDLDEESKFGGRIAEDALPDAENVTLSTVYHALIQQVIEVNPTTGQERTRYQLLSFK